MIRASGPGLVGGAEPKEDPPHANPATVAVGSVAWLLACLVAIVMSTPYRGDDLINKDIRANVHASGKTLVGFTRDLIEQWMTQQGRFFPGSLSWTYLLFWFFDSRATYKLAIGFMLVASIAAFGHLVSRLTGHWQTGAMLIPIVLALIQLRGPGFDGIVSFAALLPLTAGLCAVATTILISRRGTWWAALAALLYSLALVTYETVLLFVPIMIAVVVWKRRSWRPALALAIPALAQAMVVLILRSRLQGQPGPAYTINLGPQTVLRTFAKQVLGAFPLSQWALAADTMPAISAGAVAIGLLVAGAPTFLAVLSLGRLQVRASRAAVIAIAIFGAWMWLSSSVLVAVTVRWQLELHRGQGYLPLVFGYFGLGLCLLALLLQVERIMQGRSTRAIAAWRYGSASSVAIVAALTLAGNLVVASLP